MIASSILTRSIPSYMVSTIKATGKFSPKLNPIRNRHAKDDHTSVKKIKSCNMSLKYRIRRSTKQTCTWWQERKWWKVLLIPAMLTQQPAGESRPRSWSLSTSCHGGWTRVSNSLCPHLKITSLLHSVSTSSLLCLVPLHRIDGSPLVWCALYHVGAGPRRQHTVRRSSCCWSEAGWQGRPGYLQEKMLLFRFLVSISMGHL